MTQNEINELNSIKEMLTNYICFETTMHGGIGTALAIGDAHKEGHKDFLQWIADGGLAHLIESFESETKRANYNDLQSALWKARAEALERAIKSRGGTPCYACINWRNNKCQGENRCNFEFNEARFAGGE